jgi:hypothetical protein
MCGPYRPPACLRGARIHQRCLSYSPVLSPSRLPNQVLVNVARSLGTKTIHYTLLDPLLAMYLSTRALDRLTKVR